MCRTLGSVDPGAASQGSDGYVDKNVGSRRAILLYCRCSFEDHRASLEIHANQPTKGHSPYTLRSCTWRLSISLTSRSDPSREFCPPFAIFVMLHGTHINRPNSPPPRTGCQRLAAMWRSGVIVHISLLILLAPNNPYIYIYHNTFSTVITLSPSISPNRAISAT